jgi:soluble lytic murein transglycosylase-like protein
MAKRIIISWIVIALIFGAIGFTVGYAKTHITVNKKDEAVKTVVDYTVTENTLYGGVTKALQVKLPYTWKSKTYDFKPLNVNMSNELQEYVFYLSESYQIDFSFVMAVIQHESQFNPNIISSTHDYGLMQINQCNHEYIKETLGVTDFLDPYQNVYSGVFILRQLFQKYNDPAKVLMAYNMGEVTAKKLWDKGVYSSDYSESIMTIQKQYSEQLGR